MSAFLVCFSLFPLKLLSKRVSETKTIHIPEIWDIWCQPVHMLWLPHNHHKKR